VKTVKNSLVLWLVFEVGLVAYVMFSSRLLPERVATHFTAGGAADGWMTREDHVLWFTLFSAGVVSALVGVFYLFRFCPAKYLNVPNAEFWRSPDHYPRAMEILFVFGLRLASALCIWFMLLHYLLIDANTRSPSSLSSGGITVLTLGLLIATGGWLVQMFRAYAKLKLA